MEVAPGPARTTRARSGAYLFFFLSFAVIVVLTHAAHLGLPYFWDELGRFVPAALDIYRDGAWVPHSTVPNAHPPGVMAYLASVWHVAGYSIPVTRSAMLALASLAGPWALDHLCAAQSVAIDVAALEKYLRLLVEQPELRMRMGSAARQQAVQQFGWKSIIQAHYALWEELHAQAAAAAPRPPRGRHLRSRLFRHFAHYAADLLRDADRVRTTSHGRAVLKRKEEVLMYTDLEPVLDPKVVLSALLSLRWAERIAMPMTVADVLSCTERLVPDRRVGRMHLLWMLKYDLLAREPAQAPQAAVEERKALVAA